ncbi:MAG: hypothetical protein H6825_09300 [Planctomycetes bacterium]|nr:hypothetical protein [Planctomycetota bacterium]
MRVSVMPVVVLLALLVATPVAWANKPNVPSGTTIEFVGTGKTKVIKISGTQGCTFAVMASSSDESVATVTMTEGAAKKHTVVIQPVGVGVADVTILTENGSIGACEGFMFTYPVNVLFDEKTFLKDAKKLVSAAAKDAKAVVGVGFSQYCDELADIAADAADGVIDLNDAYFAAADALGAFQSDLGLTLDDLYDQTWAELWQDDAADIAPDEDILSLYPGGCGVWDDYVGKLTQLEDKFQSSSYKKFKKFVKVLAKAAKGDDDALLLVADYPEALALFALDEPVVTPGADPEAAPPAAPAKNLAKTWTSAGRLRSSETSRLEIGGVADPGAGAVTVTIHGPGGFTTNVVAAVGEDCMFVGSFAGLAPGSYTVELTQGANGPVAFGTVVP